MQLTLDGRRIGKCRICGRLLTDPESVSLGIGPVCRRKEDNAG